MLYKSCGCMAKRGCFCVKAQNNFVLQGIRITKFTMTKVKSSLIISF